ncbi:hypothetical protein F3Y22_tig00110549pilonHSYRG00006 [Hibiscus syriacus]|uniref:Pectinesterase inhibitor domain-containing protein n=1 Tax=Hibiscus syriacus TaxID=106335 RepID=A0A6A3ACP4_HIBSY|nr:hypothetical protein F3Y22_tig00110549pilonHSYRG00006 [Hibiscus syriacus]
MYHTSGRSNILLVLASTSALVLLLVLALVPSVAVARKSPGNAPIRSLHVHDHLRDASSACEGTLYPDLCVAVVSDISDFASKSLEELISTILNRAMYEVTLSSAKCANIEKRLKRNDTLERDAFDDCIELFNLTLAELTVARACLTPGRSRVSGNRHKLGTFLSAAMTNQYTCLDGLDGSKGNAIHTIEKSVHNISHHISNSLAMLKRVPSVNGSKSEFFPETGGREKDFPAWLSGRDRKLLLAQNDQIKFDLIVAGDGSGNFTKINDAVAAAPNNKRKRLISWINYIYST